MYEDEKKKSGQDFLTTTSLAFKLSIETPDDQASFDRLQRIIYENKLNATSITSSDEPTTRFLHVWGRLAPAGPLGNNVMSRASDIRDMYEEIFDMKCKDCKRGGYDQGECKDIFVKCEVCEKSAFNPKQSFVSQLRKKRLIKDIFAVHLKDDKTVLMKSWVLNIFGRQPIYAIKEYFGLEIATYFSWMGFYTTSLLFPSLVGLTLKMFDNQDQGPAISWVSVIGVAINFLWAAFFLVTWNSLNDYLQPAKKKYETDLKVRRTSFSPKVKILQRHKQLISAFITALVLLLVVGTSYGILKLGSTTKETLKNYAYLPKIIIKIMKLIPEILLSVCMIGFNIMYSKIARQLTSWENYQFVSTHEQALMSKLIVFRLFNAFHTLIHIAFVLGDLVLLQTRLVNLLIVQQIRTNVGEVLGSDLRVKLLQVLVSLAVCSFLSDGYVVSMHKLLGAMFVAVGVYFGKMIFLKDVKIPKIMKLVFKEKKKKEYAGQVEKESEMREFESTFLDYLEMLIQFGYIFLFFPVYPLGSTFALVNNLVEIHTDAFRLVKFSKRPFPAFKSPSNFWWYAFSLMTLCGVVTNTQIIRCSIVFAQIPQERMFFFFGLAFFVAYFGMRNLLKFQTLRNIGNTNSELNKKVS